MWPQSEQGYNLRVSVYQVQGLCSDPSHGKCSIQGKHVNDHSHDWMLQDNILHGRFLAELTREVIDDLEASKYQHAEYRISIYGRKRVEWDTLAAWICQHQLASDNVIWLIQVTTAMLRAFRAPNYL